MPASPTIGVQYHYSATRWLAVILWYDDIAGLSFGTCCWFTEHSAVAGARCRTELPSLPPLFTRSLEWLEKVTAHWHSWNESSDPPFAHLIIKKVLGYDGRWWAFVRHKYRHTLGQRQANGSGLPGAGTKGVYCLQRILKINKANYFY